ncbi:unnamed protein product [Rotaria socialis]|uniref:Uncharacterized protein n=2 Tax=Rotaria socialis TaxID=392032 RepID=A0A818A3S0_9BILA|nr:unnamed protein product [Rotaria socialis]CAF4690900.1 unnamed protein product [Rotaria socialis]
MLPEFRKQLFQLKLISTTWMYIQNRYIEEKNKFLLPIRFILSIIEKTISVLHENIIQPLFSSFYTYVNKLDHYLCSYIDTIRYFCPIVDHTSNEVFKRCGDLLFLSFIHKHSESSTTTTTTTTNMEHIPEENKFYFIQRFSQCLTSLLVIIELYSKYIRNELNDHIGRSRALWKKLNMEDGRSLDEVDSFSEKLLVLGRRMFGNYRQFLYLIRYQLKRCRRILFSSLRVHGHFRSILRCVNRKVEMSRINENLNNRARHRLVTTKKRIQHFLNIMMLHAAKHPWMRCTKPRSNSTCQTQLEEPLKYIRPMFFLSSNNTSDCSETDENVQDHPVTTFQSTPYRNIHKYSNLNQSRPQNEDTLSDISSSNLPEESFDVKDIIRQVSSQSSQSSHTSSATDHDDENRIIELALNETNDDEQQQQQQQQQQQDVSVFDLSPMLASGCAI